MKLQQLLTCLMTCFVLFISPAALADNAMAPVLPPEDGFEQGSMQIKTSAGIQSFDIEIASTSAQLAYGLMYRTSLPDNYAMLFLFGTDAMRHMWMKNTPSSLDMLFVDKRGRIVYIHPDAIPGSLQVISSPQPVRAVIEMPAGTAKANHISVGDYVIHSAFKP